MTAIVSTACGQDAKAGLRDFTPKYRIDTFSINGETSYLKKRVIQLQNAEGIRSAYWDEGSAVLTVQYNNRVVGPAAIREFFFNNGSLTNGEQAHKPKLRAAFLCCLVNPQPITIKK